MGLSSSKLLVDDQDQNQDQLLKATPVSLESLSVDEVSQYVTGLGAKYQAYGQAIAENAVDGAVLCSIESTFGSQQQVEMKEILECLEITNFLHQKVLIKEWNACLLLDSNKTALERARSLGDASEMTASTDLSTAMGSSAKSGYCARLLEAEAMDALTLGVEPLALHIAPITSVTTSKKMPRTPIAPPNVPIYISVEHQTAIEPLYLPKPESLLSPDSQELAPFRELARQVLKDLHCSIAETNLLDISHFGNRKGMNNLATAFPPSAAAPDNNGGNGSMCSPVPNIRCHFDQPNDLEICRRFVLGQNEEYYEEFVPRDIAIANGLSEAGRYYGQVIRLGNGLRVGTICGIVEERNWGNTTDQARKESLRFLATVMEQQLERRQVLLQRNVNLKQDIQHLQSNASNGDALRIDQVLTQPFGPIKAVMASQVANRHDLFPYPQDQQQSQQLGQQDNGYPTSPEYSRRSSNLPSWHFTQHAGMTERRHLHHDYFQPLDNAAAVPFGQNQGMDPTPVGKHDMERVAHINALQILQMDPLSPEAETIQALLNLTGTLLGVEFAFISVLDHQHRYLAFPTYPKGKQMVSRKLQDHLASDHFEMVQSHPQTKEPFVFRSPRQGAICNYPVMSPHHQSFVVHNLAEDQSVAPYQDVAGIGFYSGSPIVLRGQAVGVLCCTCQDPRTTDFGRAQEQQQEQLAQLISQQYDTWCLKRAMMRLERQRSLFLSCTNSSVVTHSVLTPRSPQTTAALCKMKANQPEDYAALIFTEVEDVAIMREANEEATDVALSLHNRILRTKIVEHGGYEVSTSGGDDEDDRSSFHVAFKDVVDATKFCLDAQEALHSASWDDDILSLPQACEDTVKCFRGLRVAMAIHCGSVESLSTSEASSGQHEVDYEGDTFHLAKNLLNMGHGGQILVSSDVWNVASLVAESTLGSPQIIDLGSHVMSSKSNSMRDGIITKNVLQLTPKLLAYDYLVSQRRRTTANQDSFTPGPVSGRIFPAIRSEKSVSPSFHYAPSTDSNTVAMLFVDTRDFTGGDNVKMVLAALSHRIGSVLSEESYAGKGYQCTDFLVAFETTTDAVRFGLALQESLTKKDVLEVSLNDKVKIGVQEGAFDAMGPNSTTGKAEYFGSVVHNVTLIAEAAVPGQVYLGEEQTEEDFCLMPVTNGFMLDFTGRRSFDGIEEEFVLYKCQPSKSWYDQMLENRRCDLFKC